MLTLAADALIVPATTVQMLGAGGFGAILGWYLYFINRHRKDDVQLSDFVTVVGAIGGAAVLALFPAGTDLFGAYGIGLAIGFFGYVLVLLLLVRASMRRPDGAFDWEWFLDARCRVPRADQQHSADRPMGDVHTRVPPPGVRDAGGRGRPGGETI
jgi:hypothetical protein